MRQLIKDLVRTVWTAALCVVLILAGPLVARAVYPINHIKSDVLLMQVGQPNLIARLRSQEWSAMPLAYEGLVSPDIASLKFYRNGRLSGFAGCNRLRAGYSARPGKDGITTGRISRTRKLCPPDIMAYEQSVLKALSETRSIQSIPDGLLLLSETGDPVLELRSKD